MLGNNQIPKIHRHASLERIPETCDHKEVVERWSENIRSYCSVGYSLYMGGPYSQGKSANAAIIAQSAVSQKTPMRWVCCSDICDIKFNHSEDWKQLFTTPLLILDELMLQGQTLSERDRLVERLVRERIATSKTTIITSNLSIKDLKEDFPSLTAALSECFEAVLVKGHDFRKDKKKELEKRLNNA